MEGDQLSIFNLADIERDEEGNVISILDVETGEEHVSDFYEHKPEGQTFVAAEVPVYAPVQTTEQTVENESRYQPTAIDELVSDMGDIVDPETNEIISFYSLQKEDQLELLKEFLSSKNEPIDSNFVEPITSTIEITSSDFVEASVDEVHKFDLIQRFPDMSEEEIEEELTLRKQSPSYERQGNSLRDQYYNQYVNSEVALREELQVNAVKEREQQIINAQRSATIAASNISNIDGVEMFLSEDDKLDVLNDMYTFDEKGNMEFAKELENPEYVFRLKWMDNNFHKVVNKLQDEIQLAYQQGRNEVLGRMPTTKVSHIVNNKPTSVSENITIPLTNNLREQHNVNDFDRLFATYEQ